MLMASFLLLLLLLLLLLPLCLRPAEALTNFVFGDSLVDAGNNNYLFTVSKANSPPYGIDFAPSGGQPTGRFTNGRTVFDVVVQTLGDESFPPPYLAPNASSDGLLRGGINYASGSSGILDETGSLYIGRIPLGKQVEYFEETRDYLVGIGGEKATEELLEKAVFTVATGSNDILNYLYLEPAVPWFGERKPPPALLQDIMLSNLTLHLKRLHSLGARKVVVVGVGPLGCIPHVRILKPEADGGCWEAANMLIRGYNTKLVRVISRLNEEMSPGTVFVYANSFDIVIQIIENYASYGFENAKDPCCGLSFPPLPCFGGNSSSAIALCGDRDKYVFWDAYHPTDAANVIIAKRLLDGDADDAYPINLRKLYAGQVQSK